MGCSTSSENKSSGPDASSGKRLSRFRRLTLVLDNAVKRKRPASYTNLIQNSLLGNTFLKLLLDSWTEEEISYLVEIFFRIEVNAGDCIADIEDSSKDMYVIGTGGISAFNQNGQLSQQLTVGDLVGEVDFLSGSERKEKYIAVRKSILFRLKLSDYENLLYSAQFSFNRVPLLRKIRNNEARNILAPFAIPANFKFDNEVKLMERGVFGKGFYIILKGTVKIGETVLKQNEYFGGEKFLKLIGQNNPYEDDVIVMPKTAFLAINDVGLDSPAFDPVRKHIVKQVADKKVASALDETGETIPENGTGNLRKVLSGGRIGKTGRNVETIPDQEPLDWLYSASTMGGVALDSIASLGATNTSATASSTTTNETEDCDGFNGSGSTGENCTAGIFCNVLPI